jgi:hypothetical protein
VFGFRADALGVIVSGPVGAPLRRAVDLVGVGVASGLMILLPCLELPSRVRDPRSERLAAVLAGPGAPTSFLAWAGLDAWESDARDTVGPVLRDR